VQRQLDRRIIDSRQSRLGLSQPGDEVDQDLPRALVGQRLGCVIRSDRHAKERQHAEAGRVEAVAAEVPGQELNRPGEAGEADRHHRGLVVRGRSQSGLGIGLPGGKRFAVEADAELVAEAAGLAISDERLGGFCGCVCGRRGRGLRLRCAGNGRRSEREEAGEREGKTIGHAVTIRHNDGNTETYGLPVAAALTMVNGTRGRQLPACRPGRSQRRRT